ncbi:hypothetical protein AAB992_31300 [Burkholderia contaminans]|uniref:hypothetical protein n=1 Tax=Burkholderia contaminans TaxID=488447 RepID=UPI002415CB5C|nr:hypothetical protein [Burkholderia contaminans]WFN09134.1 hypothetical protein LXE92_13405 [Burkholderia contaminans]
MSAANGAVLAEHPPVISSQPLHVRGLHARDRDALIIAMRIVDGNWTVASSYGDDVWWPAGATTNTAKSRAKLDFTAIPPHFRDTVKAIMYRLIRHGRQGKLKAGVAALKRQLDNIQFFLGYLTKLGITKLSDITPMTCSTYVQACKTAGRAPGTKQARTSIRPLTAGSLAKRFRAVETLYELSQYTDDVMQRHPWPDSSADHLSGEGKHGRSGANKTPLIPDDIFTIIFKKAWAIVENAGRILDFRDEMDAIAARSKGYSNVTVNDRRNKALEVLGWENGYGALTASLLEVRTACYIVIAAVSGCRNHELAFLRTSAYYGTEDERGERYWWMRSKSTKTGAGDTEWMIPEAAVSALKIMDRWAARYQSLLRQEIASYRTSGSSNLRLAEALEHVGAIFVGIDKRAYNKVRTVSVQQWNLKLKAFSRACGLDWDLASHQFRRKFANYAARSQFGDLRYLREHFKHWSQDMTLGYAMNESQEMALYLEIEEELDEIKSGVVDRWLDDSEPLAGGYGGALIDWRARSENITMFKNRADMIRSIAQSTAIRSNGHAWCTADDNQCIGNDLERTRCGDNCSNAVIGTRHAPVYQRLFDGLKELEACEDIGESGKARVQRDLARCRSVLTSLGHDPLGGAV